jgi:16S rRNA G966 N2-methylase RsmD
MAFAPLYNKTVIKKNFSDIEITTLQRKLANRWVDKIKNKELEKELENYDIFKEIILIGILGYPPDEIKFEQKDVEFSVADIQETTHVIFELKGTKTKDLFARQNYTKKEQETPFIQTASDMLRFAPPAAYGVCTNYNDFVLLDLKLGVTKCHKFTFTDIKNNMDKLKEFIGIFSYQKLVKQKSLVSLYDKSLSVENEFTEEFYKLFHETRLMLIKDFADKKYVTKNEAIYYTQLFLNRLIFIFFVEDRGFFSNSQLFTNRLYSILNSVDFTEHSKKTYGEISELFVAFDKGESKLGVFPFNGGLFSGVIPDKIYFSDLKDPSFFSDVRQHSKLLKSTKLNEKGEKILRKFENKLNPIITNLLLMDSFDFTSEVNVNILGHIFEQSIGDLEELRHEGKSRRKKEGVYYTPEYVTDFICRQTIIPYFSKSGVTTVNDLIEEYVDDIDVLEKKFKEIKILDPACGSGAFLIKAIDVLIEIHKEIRIVKESKGSYTIGSQFSLAKWNDESEARTIIENNIYGVDINSESVDITRLSLFLKIAEKNKKLSGLSKNIMVGNSLIDDSAIDSRAFCWEDKFSKIMKYGKFDIILGNPPYGAELTKKEQTFLNKKFGIGSTDTAQLMMKLSHSLLKKGGCHGFIVPKALIYASNWNNIRELISDELQILIDVGKVWKKVKLEQCIYMLKKDHKQDYYLNGVRKGERLSADFEIKKSKSKLFGLYLSGVDDDDIRLGEKIFKNSKKLGSVSKNSRGAIYQKFITDKGSRTVLGGGQIQRYHLDGIKGYIDDKIIENEQAYVKKNSVLVQRIIAHIEKPVDHIKITAAIPKDNSFIIVDTINQIQITDKSVSPFFILGLLNSKITNWYSYRFILGQAIRTMQFDNPVTCRIPIVVDQQEKIEKCVKELSELNEKDLAIRQKFEKNTGLNISDENKKNILSIRQKIEKSKNELNRTFYSIFNLNSKEIDLVEMSTPE